MIPVIQTRTKSLEEVDKAKEAGAIAVMVAETTQMLNIHLKEAWKRDQFLN